MKNMVKKLLYALAAAIVTFYIYGLFYTTWGEIFAIISIGTFILLKPTKWDN